MNIDPSSLISWVMWALSLLAVVYVALYAVQLFLKYKAGTQQQSIFRDADPILNQVGMDLRLAISAVWHFLRPILQVIIVLFIAWWFMKTIGIDQTFLAQIKADDVKTLLAVIVIGTFCLAAFLSDNPASWLKDLALVVIGFYFGTKVGG
jgi:hypothetical protein